MNIGSVMRRGFSGWLSTAAGARPAPLMVPLVGVLILCSAASAFAADAAGKPSTPLFVAEVLILVVAGRLLGELMQRVGQPSVMGHLLAGVVLGPSVFGALWPEAQQAIFPSSTAQKGMIDAVGQVGVLMLLLLAGMETDIGLARRTGRASFAVSICGIVLPFACGFALGMYLPDFLLPSPDERFPAALLLGTALSISSVKIVAVVVREMNFMRRNIGQVILASAVIDDTIGWIIIAITLSLVENSQLDWPTLAKSVIGTLVFLGVSFTIGRRLVFWLIRWTNDHFESELPVISLREGSPHRSLFALAGAVSIALVPPLLARASLVFFALHGAGALAVLVFAGEGPAGLEPMQPSGAFALWASLMAFSLSAKVGSEPIAKRLDEDVQLL